MKYIVNISPETLDEIDEFIKNGEYRNVQEFILTAIQNQIYLIENLENDIKTPKKQKKLTKEIKKKPLESSDLLSLHEYDINLIPKHEENLISPILSGFWNKFLPVKITMRVLANMLNNTEDPVLLDALQENASMVAREIGLSLVKVEKGSGRRRGERLHTALPIKRKEANSRLRFKSHFVGSLRRKHVDGMPATLGFMHIYRGHYGRIYVGITKEGLEYAALENPIIDYDDYDSALSLDEKEYLINRIKTGLPEEYNDMILILKTIDAGHSGTKDIVSELSTSKPDLSNNRLTIWRTGILSRLVDLGLINRIYTGLSSTYIISKNSKELIMSEN